METASRSAQAVLATAQHVLHDRPIFAMAISVVVVYILVGVAASLSFKLKRLPYPLLGKQRMRLPLSEAWERFQWTQKGPSLIHAAHEQVRIAISPTLPPYPPPRDTSRG